MAILVILLLGALWAAVLIPPILRSRNASSFGGVGDFMSRLASIGRHESRRGSGPRPVFSPMGMEPIAPPVRPMQIPGAMSPTQRRRRDVLVGMLGAAAFTFLLAFVGHSSMLWGLQLIADALLGVYVYLLVQFKHRRHEQRTKVAYLGQTRRAVMAPVRSDGHDQPLLVLRRTASY